MTDYSVKTLENGKEQHLYKILVIGDYAVGKTSLIGRYAEGTFHENYKLTIGVDFALKVLDWDYSRTINLQLWDIAGHERFGVMTRVYYRYAVAAAVVFDVTRPETLDATLKWKKDVDEKVMLSNGDPIPCLLVANKCDLDEAQLEKEQLDAFCKEYGFFSWTATSAKDNLNVDEAFHEIVEKILKLSSESRVTGTDKKGVTVNGQASTQQQSQCCS